MTNTLALRILRAHIVRSIAICLAVLLTTVLFSTVISISADVFESASIALQLAAGSDFHGSISFDALDITNGEFLERLSEEALVREAYLLSDTISVRFSETESDDKSYIRISDESALDHMFATIIDGYFPKDDEEILVNAGLYPSINVGDRITLYLTGYSDDTLTATNALVSPTEFVVSGLFTSMADIRAQGAVFGLYNMDTYSSATVYIQFSNAINVEGKLKIIVEKLQKEFSSGGFWENVNDAYFTASVPDISGIALVVFCVAVVFLCAFLLIYNIYSIALAQDLRTLGMLGVIGMMYRQMKQMVRRQSDVLFLISVFPGILLGYFIGMRTLSPLFMSLYERNLPYTGGGVVSIVISAVLTYITVTYSAMRPLKRMEKISLLDTLDYVSNEGRKSNSRKNKSFPCLNPVQLAVKAHGTKRLNLLVTSLSVALAVILFLLIGTLSELMENMTLNTMRAFDLVAQVKTVFGDVDSNYLDDRNMTMDCEVYEELKDAAGAEEIYALYWVKQTITLSEEQTVRAKEALSLEQAEFGDLFMEDFASSYYDNLISAASGSIDAVFLGVPDELWTYVIVANEGDKYAYGDTLPVGMENMVLSVRPNTFYNESGYTFHYFTEGEILSDSGLKKMYRIYEQKEDEEGGTFYYVRGRLLYYIVGYINTSFYSQLFVMPLSQFEEEFGHKGRIYAVAANAKSDNADKLRAEFNRVTAKYPVADENYYISVSGRLDQMEELHERLGILRIVGYTLSVIVFFIGVINVVNYSFTQTVFRRREYAMLESIGMTRRQLRSMMVAENCLCTVIAAVITFAAGMPITKYLLGLAMEHTVHIHLLDGILAMIAMAVLAVVVSLVCHRILLKEAVTERLKIRE